MNRDPVTNKPLPPNAIQRVLFLAQDCHIYRIPPPSSPRYLTAALWTANPADHIFTARLRLLETAIPASTTASSTPNKPTTHPQEPDEQVTATLLLEDPKTSDLFAAAPYTHPSAVTQATDSSRFFAIRVVGEGGMKATLGLGFEERPVAFDFSIALQDARRTLRLDLPSGAAASAAGRAAAGARGAQQQQQQQQQQQAQKQADEAKRDLSLKEGEMITIKIGGKGRRAASSSQQSSEHAASSNPFAIAPPPPPPGGSAKTAAASSAVPVLAPPVSNSAAVADDDGFDDGEFGEFQ